LWGSNSLSRVTASRYAEVPSVRSLLCRRGELAVLFLRDLAREGHDGAVDDLLAVGTTGAAEALLELMWHRSSGIARRSAFAIAVLFQIPEVFAVLSEMTLNHPPEEEWVWRPFESEEPTAIPVIAGRVASLLRSAHELNDLPEVVLDPRLLLPVLAQAGSELTFPNSSGESRLPASLIGTTG